MASQPWINGRRWDLTWIIGSAAVVPIGLLLVWGGMRSEVMDLAVTALVGGPHVFATFLSTYLDPRFRRSHRGSLIAAALLVPAFVVAMTLLDFQILISLFVFAASLHVLQQNAFLADAYRDRQGRPDSLRSRLLDYAVLFLSFYPIASYKLVHDDFLLGDIQILIPAFARTDFTWMSVSAAFAVALVAWIAKTILEVRRGRLNGPKTLLIALTSAIAFLIPCAASGARLELAFQTVNIWHSIQYLAVVWLALKLRKSRGRIESPFVGSLIGSRASAWRFYGLCLLATGGLFVAILALKTADPFGIRAPQYYYMGVLSVLFIHYAFDALFFLRSDRGVDRSDLLPIAD